MRGVVTGAAALASPVVYRKIGNLGLATAGRGWRIGPGRYVAGFTTVGMAVDFAATCAIAAYRRHKARVKRDAQRLYVPSMYREEQ